MTNKNDCDSIKAIQKRIENKSHKRLSIEYTKNIQWIRKVSGGQNQWTIQHQLIINMLVVWQVKVPVQKRPLPIDYKRYTGKDRMKR